MSEKIRVAIDSSSDTAGIALIQGGLTVAEVSWRCRQKHTVHLLPHLDFLLSQTGLSLDMAECIIVAIGPGSYNGLRVGVNAAKGLAFSLGIPIIGISTLESAAFQYAITGLPICPVFSAGREELGTAEYRLVDNEWRQTKAAHLTTLGSLCAVTLEQTVFCGEHLPVIATELTNILGDKAIIPSSITDFRRAVFLAELGGRRFEVGDYDDTAALQPFYFRGPPIMESKHIKKES